MTYLFSSCLYKDENQAVQALLDVLDWPDETAKQAHADAVALVESVRTQKGRGGQLETFLQEFSLNTEEGLAMMCLAEALLRIPDAKTANALIKDKVIAARWLQKQGGGWMSKAAGLGMSAARKTLDSALSRLGEPVIREAMIRAMQMMGKHFVLGTSIEDALSHARMWERQGYRMSYDMLGESARDYDTAEQYFDAYSAAIDAISSNKNGAGISVKLSALHPRYTYSQKERCIPEITEKLKMLAAQAAAYNMPLTVDAEEANRLDLSIKIIENMLADKVFDGWDGFGLAVQAYQKRSLPLIDYLAERTRKYARQLQIRLVKGRIGILRLNMPKWAAFPHIRSLHAKITQIYAIWPAHRHYFSMPIRFTPCSPPITPIQLPRCSTCRMESPLNSSGCTAWAKGCTRISYRIRM